MNPPPKTKNRLSRPSSPSKKQVKPFSLIFTRVLKEWTHFEISSVVPSRSEIENYTLNHDSIGFIKKVLQGLSLLTRDVIFRLATKDLLVKSSAITYNLILSLVPLLAIGFTFFQLFGGLDNLLQSVVIPKIEVYFDPSVGRVMTGYLQGFVGNIQTERLGATALFTFLLTVISLLGSVENAFNEISESKHERPLMQRFLNYWLLLTLTPFAVVLSTVKSTEFLAQISTYFPVNLGLIEDTPSIIFRFLGAFLVEILAFSLLYYVLPAKRIAPLAALMGGFAAAIGFESLQWVNSYSSAKLFEEASVVQLYGSVPLLAVIIFIWFRLVALVLLTGMIISTSFQRVFAPRKSHSDRSKCPSSSLANTAQIFALVGDAYLKGSRGVSRELMMRRFSLSRTEVGQIISWLEHIELIWAHRDSKRTRYTPTSEGLSLLKKPEVFVQKVLGIQSELPLKERPLQKPRLDSDTSQFPFQFQIQFQHSEFIARVTELVRLSKSTRVQK